MTSDWIRVCDRTPELRDDGVIAYFSETGSIETVNILDYFSPTTNGVDEKGGQMYTTWASSQGVTHWMPLPAPPPKE